MPGADRRSTPVLSRRGFGRAAGLAAMLAATGTACTNRRPDAGSIVWGLAAAPRSLDPAHAFDPNSANIFSSLYDQLVMLTPAGEIRNHLAESWRQVDDLTYVYTIRDGVRFWDGSPLTVEDVVYSMNRHRDEKVASEYAYYYGKVRSIGVTGPRELTVRMSSVDNFFRFVPGIAAHVMKRGYVQAKGADFGGPAALTMATGPYRPVSYSAATGAVVVRHDRWWGPRPPVGRVDFQIVTDPETLRLAMESGDIDITRSVPLDASDRWDRTPGLHVGYRRSPTVTNLSFDTRTPPWDDLHVRRAVSYAVDREGLVEALFNGHARVPRSPVAPEYWDGLAPAAETQAFYRSLPDYRFDLDRARQELARSGHPRGFTTTMRYDSSDLAVAKMLQNVARNLSRIGITLRLQGIPAAAATAELYGHRDLGLRVVHFAPDYRDPAAVLDLCLARSQLARNGWNFAQYTDPEIERLLRVQAAGPDPRRRVPALRQLTRIMAERQLYLGLCLTDVPLAHAQNLSFEGGYSLWSLYYNQPLTHVRVTS